MPDIPAVRVGTRLALGADEWKLGRAQEPGQPFTLIVTRVRTELAHHYGNEWVWVTGHDEGCVGDHAPCSEALVRTAVLRHREEALTSAAR